MLFLSNLTLSETCDLCEVVGRRDHFSSVNTSMTFSISLDFQSYLIICLCNFKQSSFLATELWSYMPSAMIPHMPVLAGTSPWHGPCWLKWQISSSAEWWGFFVTFNAALISAIDRVLMSDFVVVLSFQECISKYLYAYTVCTLCSVYVCFQES